MCCSCCACCDQHGGFVPSPDLSVQVAQPEAEEAQPCLYKPLTMMVCVLVMVSHFLTSREAVYDVTVKVQVLALWLMSMGSRPTAFLAYEINGQYIGRTHVQLPVYSGRLGFHNLRLIQGTKHSKLNWLFLVFTGFVCVLWSVFMARVFMRIKLLD